MCKLFKFFESLAVMTAHKSLSSVTQIEFLPIFTATSDGIPMRWVLTENYYRLQPLDVTLIELHIQQFILYNMVFYSVASCK